jgi:ribosomal protein S8
MQWLDKVADEDNQDMRSEFIGNLIMREGFKVRYNNIEEYSSSLQEKITRVFAKNGYSVELKYLQNYAYLEVTALKQKPKYVDYAIAVGLLWGGYRFVASYLL